MLYKHQLLTCLFLAGSLLLVDLSKSDSELNENKYIREGEDFQAINSYLTSIEPLKIEKSVVVPYLKDAIDTIESLGMENFDNLDPNTDDLNIVVKSFIGNDLKVILTILRDLISASKSCDQEAMNFLTIVDQQTFDGQLLNQYGKSLLEDCLTFNLSIMVPKIEFAIGKVQSSIFELIADIAKRVSNMNKEKQRVTTGGITIRDQGAPNDTNELLLLLKQISFESSQLRTFVLALNAIFNSLLPVDADDKRLSMTKKEEIDRLETFYKNSLVIPCKAILDRIGAPLSHYLNFKQYLRGQAVNNLEYKRNSDLTFDYYLEIFRICNLVSKNEDAIWKMLNGMR